MVFKKLIISEQIIGLFCELSRRFIHSPITIATTEPPSRITRSVFLVLSCSTYCGTIAPSIVQRRHPISRRDPRAPGGRRTAGSGGSGSGRSPEARPESTTRRGDDRHRSRSRRSDSDFCPSRRRQSDAERGVASDEMFNVEEQVGGNETSNIQGGIGGEW
jgi:hypothetical protein